MRRAKTSQTTVAILSRVLATALAAGVDAGTGHVSLQVLPARDFVPSDGRSMDVPAWRIDAEIAQRVIDAFDARQPLVIDYEHQTLHKESNGQPAPAAGWIHGFTWRDGAGLFADVELTQRARELIDAGEYRYFSPVLEYDRKSGNVVRILMGALTNNPAIHGMQAVNLLAAATARLQSLASQQPESTVNLLQKLLAALGLPEDSTEDQALARVAEVLGDHEAARDALELDAAADAEALTAAIAALKEKAVAAASAQTPDPARFVPVTVVQELQANVAALTARQQARDAEDLIAPALADGRLLPAEEAWARGMAATAGGVTALSELLKVRQPIAALTSTQTRGQPPQNEGAHGLSADELAVAAACGITPENFAAARA